MKQKTFLFLALLMPFLVSAVETPATTIDRVQFNADSGQFYVYKHEGWGVCSNTKFVQLRGSAENKDRFISQVLAAHMAKARVQFIDGCTNSNGYLDATYLFIY